MLWFRRWRNTSDAINSQNQNASKLYRYMPNPFLLRPWLSIYVRQWISSSCHSFKGLSEPWLIQIARPCARPLVLMWASNTGYQVLSIATWYWYIREFYQLYIHFYTPTIIQVMLCAYQPNHSTNTWLDGYICRASFTCINNTPQSSTQPWRKDELETVE